MLMHLYGILFLEVKEKMFSGFRKKYIGDRQLYRRVLYMVIPMILQNLVTNLVSLIDNIMVGRMGTEQMSGVSIANQFIFVFNITLFGAVSGPGIFGAQFFGKGDSEGQKYTFRFRIMISALISLVAFAVYSIFDKELISLFISKDDTAEKIAQTLMYGRQYLGIMLISLLPFGVGQAYSSVLSECGHTKIPMMASMSAVGINIFLDYALIFGKFGMPEMGVKGAAIATVTAKFIETIIKIVWTHTHYEKNRYAAGVYRGIYIPSKLMADMIKRGTPLLANEFLWAAGMSIIAQSYSIRGLEVVAARNIASTISNLFSTVYIQLGACIAIIVGATLGANKLKEARDTDNKLLFFSLSVSVVVGLMMLPLAKFFPMLYNTEESVRSLASYMIVIQSMAMPLWSYANACYFTLRCGGKTGITFLFDFGGTWLVILPLSTILARFTDMDIRMLFMIVTFAEIVKVIAGYFMVRSDIWINNIIDDVGDSKAET